MSGIYNDFYHLFQMSTLIVGGRFSNQSYKWIINYRLKNDDFCFRAPSGIFMPFSCRWNWTVWLISINIWIKSDNIFSGGRKPKLFWISTSSTTTTISTTTLCYSTSAAAACTSGRKRRAINFMDKKDIDEEASMLNPAPVDTKERSGLNDIFGQNIDCN